MNLNELNIKNSTINNFLIDGRGKNNFLLTVNEEQQLLKYLDLNFILKIVH